MSPTRAQAPLSDERRSCSRYTAARPGAARRRSAGGARRRPRRSRARPRATGEGWRCDVGDEDDERDGVVDPHDVAAGDRLRCADGDGYDDCALGGAPSRSHGGLDTDDGTCDGSDEDDDGDGICGAFDSEVPRPVEPAPRVDGGCGAGDGDASVLSAIIAP